MPWSVLDFDIDVFARQRRISSINSDGWKWLEASSHAEAMRILIEERPDVVLVTTRDSVDDLAFCRDVKSNVATARSPVIIISATQSQASFRDAMSAGVDAWLREPADISQLTAIIEALAATTVRHPPHQRKHYDDDGPGMRIPELAPAVDKTDAEKNLHENKEQFRAMFDQANVGVAQGSIDGKFLLVNERFCEMTGYSREELLTMSYRDLINPEDLPDGLARHQSLLRGEIQPVSYERRIVRKDKRLGFVRISLSLLRPSDGSPHSIVAFVEDVTARREAEEALQRELRFDKQIADLFTRLASQSGAQLQWAIVDTLRALAEYCGADHAYLTQPTEKPKTSCMTHEWCAPHVSPRISESQAITAAGFPWSCKKAHTNEPVALSNLAELPEEAALDRVYLEQEGALALLHVPIKNHDDRVVGCIGLHQHRHTQVWSSSDVARVRMIGNAISAILERQRAEERVRDSEAKFAAVFRTCSEAIVISSESDQKIVDANAAFSNLSGYTRDEVVGKTMEELNLSINHPGGARPWSNLLEKRIVPDLDVTVRTKSGALRTGIASRVLVTVNQSQYAISMFRDLTWRMQAEQSLRRQAAFDQLMARILSEFVMCPAAQFEHTVDRALGSIAAFFGADHLVLLNVSSETQTWRVAQQWCAPDIPELPSDDAVLLTHDRLSSGAEFLFSTDNLDPAGGYRLEVCRSEGATFVMNVPLHGASGVITARISLHRHRDRTPWTSLDASQLRMAGNAIIGAWERSRAERALLESEKSFRDIADQTPVMTFMSGPDRSAVFYNNQALSFFGASLDALVGDQWIGRVHPEDRESYVRACYNAADARKPLSAEARFLRADGEYRWLLVSGMPRFSDGAYAGHIGTGVDITDLKRSFERHLNAQKLYGLGTLAAGVAHNFNNMLGSIIARADCAQGELEDGATAREHIDEIIAIALRGAETVEQLTSFARQDTVPFELLNLSDVVAGMLGLLRVSIPSNAILNTDLSERLPPVLGNTAEIREAVINLVMNAAESLEKREGQITIATRVHDADRQSPERPSEHAPVLIEVTDTGCGMTDEIKARVFDPFFSTKFIGRGLGLAVVQGIVRRHNGSIEVTTIPGKGSRFSILLPPARVLPA